MLHIALNPVFLPLLATRLGEGELHLLYFGFKTLIVIVFIGMNILYQLFWKKSAQADYFEALGVKVEPSPIEQFEFVARKEVRPHRCHCGFDLGMDPDRWRLTDGEVTPRCPQCEREIFLDQLDLPPANADVPPAKSTTAAIAVAMQPPPLLIPQPTVATFIEETPDEVEVAEPPAEIKETSVKLVEPEVETIGIGS